MVRNNQTIGWVVVVVVRDAQVVRTTHAVDADRVTLLRRGPSGRAAAITLHHVTSAASAGGAASARASLSRALTTRRLAAGSRVTRATRVGSTFPPRLAARLSASHRHRFSARPGTTRCG